MGDDRLISTMTTRGRLTLPAEVMERLGVKRGERVEFVIEDGKVIVRGHGGLSLATLPDIAEGKYC